MDRELSISQTVSTRPQRTRRGPCRAQCHAGTAVQLLRATRQRQPGSLRLPRVSILSHERGMCRGRAVWPGTRFCPWAPFLICEEWVLAHPPCAGEVNALMDAKARTVGPGQR